MHRVQSVLLFSVCAAFLAVAGASFARPGFGPPDSDRDPGAFIEQNAEALGLDQATLDKIRTIVAKSKDEGDALHAQLSELHQGMKALLDQDSPDESAVMQQIDRIGAAETEMHKHRVHTMLAIRALLTPEQREKMTQLRDDSRGRWKQALMEDCKSDLASLCPDAGDRWSQKQCLAEHSDTVSPACQAAMQAARRAHHGHHGGWSDHPGADCPMHPGADCPMKDGADCPMMHRGAGNADQSDAGNSY
jgi:protein CpxP